MASETWPTSSRAATRGRDVLAHRIGRHHDVAVGRRELDDQQGDVLGQPVGVGRVLGLQHLGHALQRGG